MAVDRSFTRYGNSPGALGDRNDEPLRTNRFLGGKERTNQFFIGGYFYVILRPPQFAFPDNQSAEFETLVMSTVRTFTPHTITPGFVDDTVMGGMGQSYANGRSDVTREFTLTFKDLQNLPILQMFMQWENTFSNAWYGVSSMDGDEFIPRNYKGDCFVIITRPSVSNANTSNRFISERDVEQVYYYDGVIPKSLPVDTLNQDLNTNEMIDLSVTMGFDGYPLDKSYKEVLQQAITEFNSRADWRDVYDRHYSPNGPFVRANTQGYSKFTYGRGE